jgi:hypothetical protein
VQFFFLFFLFSNPSQSIFLSLLCVCVAGEEVGQPHNTTTATTTTRKSLP